LGTTKKLFVELTIPQANLIRDTLRSAQLAKSKRTIANKITKVLDEAENPLPKKFELQTPAAPRLTAVAVPMELPEITEAEFTVLRFLDEANNKATANDLLTTHAFLQRMLDLKILTRRIFAGTWDYSMTSIGRKVYDAKAKQLYK
jgi:hypothetical protein